jgi:two-component system chemotaxis response regulator CheY
VRTLIVEDDFTSRLLLQVLLARYGECHVAINGREAVEAFRLAQADGRGYDLICMDVTMPEMDGHQAVQEIRRLEKTVKPLVNRVTIIMTSASNDQEDVGLARQEECDGYLLKPIDAHRLKSLLWGRGLI